MPSLFRYFSRTHADAFLKRGEVLLRSLAYFRDYEDEGVRADEYEGSLVHLPEDGLTIKRVPSGEEVSVPYTFESSVKEEDIFIYCMSTEFSEDIARRFKAEVCVEILEPIKFLARLRVSLGLRPRFHAASLVYDAVRYYEPHEPPLIDWALPEKISLRKPKAFAWQKEYRFAVPRGDAFRVENVEVKLVPLGQGQHTPQLAQHDSKTIRLGNLSKICRVYTI